jgi:hypothetical protein
MMTIKLTNGLIIRVTLEIVRKLQKENKILYAVSTK